MNTRTIFACLSGGLLLVGGCSQKEESTPANRASAEGSTNSPAAKGTIGLSVLTMTNPFFKEIADSMTREARKDGYEVLVVSGEFDVAIRL